MDTQIAKITLQAMKRVRKTINTTKITKRKYCKLIVHEIFKDKTMTNYYKKYKRINKNNPFFKIEKTYKQFKHNFRKGFMKECTRKATR
tara:strand:+ start:138 stop:404 length:267 start_codon:yes stop_codon:yes gene_type:complete